MKTNMLLRYAFAMFAVFVISGVAHAEDWKVTGEFGWFGVGKAYQIEKGHFYWVGEFSGTFFNDKGKGSHFHHAVVKCPAFYDGDFNASRRSSGHCAYRVNPVARVPGR